MRKKRIQAGVWMDVSLKLGGLVALFGGMAAALALMLASTPRP